MTTSDHGDTPALSIIICTYNRGALLKGCITAIGVQLEESNAELVVIVDGSTDDTQAILDQTSVPLVRGGWSQNRGLNAARNEGLRLARAPVVLYFDDDQIPPGGYLLHVLNEMGPDLDGVGGPLRDKGGGLHTCAKCSLGDSTLGEEARFVDQLIGGNMALRTAAFNAVGQFDERLSGRGDETEWFRRAAGLRLYYNPDLWVWHRRDSFDIRQLCRYAYRQGKAAPVYAAITSAPKRGRRRKAARYLAHTVRHWCSHGLELFCREVGAMAASTQRTIDRTPNQQRGS